MSDWTKCLPAKSRRRSPAIGFAPFAVNADGGRIAAVLDAMTGRADYEAGAGGRIRWMPGDPTAPSPAEYELTTIRNRTRKQVRDNPLAAAGVETRAINIVTHKLRPQSQAKGDDPKMIAPRFRGYQITEEQAERFRVQIEEAWPIFAKHVDPAGILEMEDLVYLAGRKAFGEDGEILIHKTVSPLEEGRQFYTTFEPIEVDRLTTPFGKGNDENVRGGIKFREDGKPLSYYILKKHPQVGLGFSMTEFNEVPAAEIRHLFRVRRPGQWRGVPDVVTSLQALRDHKDLQDATVLKAQHSAAITGVMSTESPADVEDDYNDESEDDGDRTWSTFSVPPGQFMVLPHNDGITEFQSDHPSQTYESFLKGVKADAAIGQLMSRLTLTREGEGVNYSSMRGLYLQDRMVFLFDRSLLTRRLLNWIWAAFVDEAVMRGWVDAPNYRERREAYLRVTWQFGAWGWVDPVKEVTAQILAVDNDIKSLAEVCQSEGGDAEETIRANARLRALRRELNPGLQEKSSAPPSKEEDEEDDRRAKVADLAARLVVELAEDDSPRWNGKARY